MSTTAPASRSRTSQAESFEAIAGGQSHRRLSVTIVLLGTVLAGFFASPVVLRRVSDHGDLGWHFLPMRGLYARYLQEAKSFDWVPEMFGGYLLTGEGQHGPYHPLHYLMYRFLPLDIAFPLEIFLPTVFMGAGLVFFLKRHIALPGACMGGLLGAFSLNFVVHMQQPCITWIVAHLPWLMAAIDEVIETDSARRRRLAFAAIALLTGSQVLLGHPQSTWFTMFVAALFALHQLILKRSSLRTWCLVAGGVVLGVGLGAVQLLATYELLTTTYRSTTDISELPYPAIEPRYFVGIFEPGRVWGDVFPTYFGTVPVVLACWVLGTLRYQRNAGATWSRRDTLHMALWAMGATAVTAVLSLGQEGYLYRLQMLLPLVGSFRGPARYLMMSQICLAIAAAVAYARLVHLSNEERDVPRTLVVVPWVLFGISVLLALRTFVRGSYDPADTRFQSQLYAGPIFFLATALAIQFALRGNRRTRQLGLVAVAGIAAIDLGLYCVGNSHLGKIYWRRLPTYEQYLASHPVPPETPEEVTGRILHEGNPGDFLKRINPYLLMGYRATNGNAGLYVRRSLDYRDLNTLRVAETSWYWQPPNDTLHVQGLERPPGGGWMAIPDPLPRARLVTHAVASDSPGDDLKKIDVDTTALVARPIGLPDAKPGEANVVLDEPGQISVDVEASSRQLLVLTESHHDSWRVTVDGEPVEAERVNGDFVGCVVEPGEHRVDFEFRCTALRVGKAISLGSLSLVFVVLVWPFRPWRRLHDQDDRALVDETPDPLSNNGPPEPRPASAGPAPSSETE